MSVYSVGGQRTVPFSAGAQAACDPPTRCGRLEHHTGVSKRDRKLNRTDLTDDHKEKEKRSNKERETDYDDDVASPGELPMIIDKVGPVYSPMWVHFSRRLPTGRYASAEPHGRVRGVSADRATLAILYRTGLRINEALSLYPKDLNLAEGSIRVLG